MAKIKIGGQQMDLPPASFKTLKKIWPHVTQIQGIMTAAQEAANGRELTPEEFIQLQDPIALMEHGVAIVGYLLLQMDPQWTLERVEETITADETHQLEDVINEIMIESGFSKREGGTGAEKGESSTATGTLSSPSSLPPAVQAETGT